jgi:hypothetical protein
MSDRILRRQNLTRIQEEGAYPGSHAIPKPIRFDPLVTAYQPSSKP